jgi:hypothetical protein
MMKRAVIIFMVLITIIASNCGNVSNKGDTTGMQTSDTGKAIITFKEYEHDFGKVAEGEKLSYTFSFQNKGTSDLVILSATTTCGCTVPKYNVNPISPENNGNMEVVFDTSDRSGTQTKTITVTSNASVPVILLKITADVLTTN